MLLAVTLRPNPMGLGTHQQLGLPPCTMRIMLELRCPACGMTTSWAHFVRGQWLRSVRVNSGGFLLALYAVALLVACGIVCWTGALPGEKWRDWAAWAVLAIAVVTVTDWAGRVIAEKFL
jgi:hypothetical protein